MTTLAYGMFDADNHYYEPDDCFTRHIEERYRKQTVWIDRREQGPARMYVGEERCNFFSVAVGDHVGPPGLMKAFLKGMTDGGFNPNVEPMNALAVPEFVERRARLAKMDEQGVDACLMLPTAGVGVEPQLRKDPDLLYASLRAFNRWVEEDWGYGGDRRIFGAPLVSLVDLDRAIAEVDRVAACGARFVILTAGPVDGRLTLSRPTPSSIPSGPGSRKPGSTWSTTSVRRPSARSTTCPGACAPTRRRTAIP